MCVVASGIGGVGKTTLVRQYVATRAAERFPEGSAWIDSAKAIDFHERSLALNEELGSLEAQANQLGNLALCYRDWRDAEKARSHRERSLTLLRRMGLGDDHPSVRLVLQVLA